MATVPREDVRRLIQAAQIAHGLDRDEAPTPWTDFRTLTWRGRLGVVAMGCGLAGFFLALPWVLWLLVAALGGGR